MTTGSPPPGDDDGPSPSRIQPWEMPTDPFATSGVRVRRPSNSAAGEPVVPEDQRFCANCASPVGRSRDGRSGLTEGFCPRCGTRFSFTPALARGAVVGGRYEVFGAIAHGHTGWIYGATDLDRRRLVVLKPVGPSGDELAASAGTSRALVELDHPNIASIYGTVAHRDSGTVFVVMEYVANPSLLESVSGPHRRGRPAPLPIGTVLPQGLQILSAVGYLHRNGLVHGDVTPDNIVANGNQVKLIDLDTIRRIDDHDSPIRVTDGYAAPELAEAGPSVATDLYAVGRTLAALSFDFVHYTTTYQYTLPPPDDVRLFARFPSYHRFLLRATDPDPSRRFESAEQMYDQLSGVLRESSSLEEPTPSRSVVFGEQPRPFGQLVVHDGTRSLLPLAAADVVGALPDTLAETMVSPVRDLIEQGRLTEARERLADARQAADWLLTWHWGLLALADDEPAAAQTAFADVYAQLPGELAPKLALAASAELAGDLATAAQYYELVWRNDSWCVSAGMGLARVREAQHDHETASQILRSLLVVSPEPPDGGKTSNRPRHRSHWRTFVTGLAESLLPVPPPRRPVRHRSGWEQVNARLNDVYSRLGPPSRAGKDGQR